jgi:hypothetical protein
MHSDGTRQGPALGLATSLRKFQFVDHRFDARLGAFFVVFRRCARDSR